MVVVTLSNIPDASRCESVAYKRERHRPQCRSLPRFLVGDTNQTGRISAADVSGAKLQAPYPQMAETSRFDANGDGVIDAKDAAIVKARQGRCCRSAGRTKHKHWCGVWAAMQSNCAPVLRVWEWQLMLQMRSTQTAQMKRGRDF